MQNRSHSKIAPDSTETKKTKVLLKRDAQKRAFIELLGRKNANGGKNTYSDVAYIISKYSKCGCGAYVTRKILEYQCRLYKKGLGLQKESNNVVT